MVIAIKDRINAEYASEHVSAVSGEEMDE